MITDAGKVYTHFVKNFLVSKSTSGWYVMPCPFSCKESSFKKKFCVKPSWGVVKCWVCDYRTTVINFMMDYHGVDYPTAKNMLASEESSAVVFEEDYAGIIPDSRKSSLKMPYGYKSLLSGSGVIADRARNYLKGRGFDVEYLDSIGFGYCDEEPDVNSFESEKDWYINNYFGYIIMPYIGLGMLKYYVGREFLGSGKDRYKNPLKGLIGVGKEQLVYNEDALFLHDRVWKFEGIFDALTIGSEGIAIGGWSMSPEQFIKILSSGVEELVFVPDRMEENSVVDFYKEDVKLATRFLPHKKVKVIDLDSHGLEGKDANDVGKKALLSAYERTPYLTASSAIQILNQKRT